MADTMTQAPARKRGRSIPTYYYYIGAAGVAVAYFLYRKSKTSTTATTAATTPVDTSGTAATPTAASTAGDQATTAADLVSAIQALQGAGSTSSTASSGYTPPTNVAPSGSGYKSTSAGPITNAAGSQFEQLSGYPAAQTLLKNGGTVYYQPVPGVFQQVKKLTGGKNTYYFTKVA